MVKACPVAGSHRSVPARFYTWKFRLCPDETNIDRNRPARPGRGLLRAAVFAAVVALISETLFCVQFCTKKSMNASANIFNN